jgi:hypothetical protein
LIHILLVNHSFFNKIVNHKDVMLPRAHPEGSSVFVKLAPPAV